MTTTASEQPCLGCGARETPQQGCTDPCCPESPWHTSLREQPLDYPAAARAIALHLAEFCDSALPFPEMIAEAARRSVKERDTRASWLAQWLITNHGGTPDLPAWVAQSARYYAEATKRADTAEQQLHEMRDHYEREEEKAAEREKEHDATIERLTAELRQLRAQAPHRAGCAWEHGQACTCRRGVE